MPVVGNPVNRLASKNWWHQGNFYGVPDPFLSEDPRATYPAASTVPFPAFSLVGKVPAWVSLEGWAISREGLVSSLDAS